MFYHSMQLNKVCRAGSNYYNVQPKAALLLAPGVGVGVSNGLLGTKSSLTDGQRWDGWGRLTQSLFSTVPHLATIGALQQFSIYCLAMKQSRLLISTLYCQKWLMND